MHISLAVGAVLIVVVIVGALAIWYFTKPAVQPPSKPTTGAVTQSDALNALQNELDAATSKIDTTAMENALLQK